MGFKVFIEIECEESNEIIQHLNKIKSDLTKEIKKKTSISDEDRLPLVDLYDNNCYGTHEVKIITD